MPIPSHIFYFSLILGGTSIVALAISQGFGKSEDEKRRVLESNHSNPFNREESKKRMQVFFNTLKSKENAEINDKLDALLKAGKDDGKRYDQVTTSKLHLSELDKQKGDEKDSLANNESTRSNI